MDSLVEDSAPVEFQTLLNQMYHFLAGEKETKKELKSVWLINLTVLLRPDSDCMFGILFPPFLVR